ncbi:uncharacterized protein LOC111777308 [Cucurbita pepo subsp. pepo]|uniref:uncharacterized protein LOC111777308 n=1 Tax=Cucurbita pepo subsp. pepo TaxID=3664 RepID=UPI000C9D6A58|nr:uncharacterized protein LOC111777308 [Cucurbita pepo subsp. pepo]
MWRAEEGCRESKQGEVEDKDCISRGVLSAGTTLLMAACLKRAVVLFFLVEQWRIWVFLALNLILVTIFFTSSPASYGESQTPEPMKKKKIRSSEPEKVEEVEIKQQEMDKEEECEEDEEEEEIGLSKEELNERVEAFIVMFKKQLISDARKVGSRRTPLSYKKTQ